MKKWNCHNCSNTFSRIWNLQRHLKSVHTVYNESNNETVQSFSPYHHLQLNHVENYQNRTNNLDPMNYYQNSYYYEKNADNSIPYSRYHNLRPYSSYFDSLFREEKKLTLDDNLKIQKTLKNLENYLENIYPSDYIVRVIAWLRYSCRTDRSEEPLKKISSSESFRISLAILKLINS